MKESNNIYMPIFVGLAMSLGVIIGSKLDFNSTTTALFSSNVKKEKLNRLIDYIDYEYVDPINTDSIVDVTVNSILGNLDPHSVYIPENELENITENMQGDFIGIGVSYYPYKDTISVINTIKGGPGEKSGILSGDRILMADNDTLYGEGLVRDGLANKLKGPLNSKVQLKVYRRDKGTFNVQIKRGRVPLYSVDAYYKLTENLGYIKINRFSETTYIEFKKALDALNMLSINGLVIDLRDNGGGFVTPVLKIADEFLKKDQLIMYTKNKKGTVNKHFSTEKGTFEKGNIYILINENTASASEILAGAVQDNDRGVIVGRRSFGKGLVQREMSLGDGSAVRLTTSRYYTPTGRSIQRPYKKNGNEEYFNEYLERYRNGELQHADSIQVADSLKFETPGGKIVYGGGGIIPDIFIGKDTTRASETLSYLMRSGQVGGYVFELLDKRRAYYNSIKIEEFDKKVVIQDDIIKGFISYIRSRGIELEIENYRSLLKTYLKATMAQQLFGVSYYQKILNKNDEMITKVINRAEKPQ